MIFEEVILRFPMSIQALDDAIAAFAEQYRVVVYTEIRGHVTLSGEQYYLLDDWFQVQLIDHDLDILGLEQTEDEDELLWIRPTGPGEIRLSPLIEDE